MATVGQSLKFPGDNVPGIKLTTTRQSIAQARELKRPTSNST